MLKLDTAISIGIKIKTVTGTSQRTVDAFWTGNGWWFNRAAAKRYDSVNDAREELGEIVTAADEYAFGGQGFQEMTQARIFIVGNVFTHGQVVDIDLGAIPITWLDVGCFNDETRGYAPQWDEENLGNVGPAF